VARHAGARYSMVLTGAIQSFAALWLISLFLHIRKYGNLSENRAACKPETTIDSHSL